MAQGLRQRPALLEDLSLVPSTHGKWLESIRPAPRNPVPLASSGTSKHIVCPSVDTHTCTWVRIIKLNI